jgi:hypothetical protein
MQNGWRYSDSETFKQRFPEWRIERDNWVTLLQECAELIDGRWEHFIVHVITEPIEDSDDGSSQKRRIKQKKK